MHFTPCSCNSIVDFKQVNICLVRAWLTKGHNQDGKLNTKLKLKYCIFGFYCSGIFMKEVCHLTGIAKVSNNTWFYKTGIMYKEPLDLENDVLKQ